MLVNFMFTSLRVQTRTETVMMRTAISAVSTMCHLTNWFNSDFKSARRYFDKKTIHTYERTALHRTADLQAKSGKQMNPFYKHWPTTWSATSSLQTRNV